MHTFVGFAITGLVTAGIYALVAGGLTLTYTTTGIFNWAHGAFAAIGAFCYWQLTVGWGIPKAFALFICVTIIGPAVGVTVETGIMRRLGATNEITRMAVTLALLIGIVAGLNWIWNPGSPRSVPPLLGNRAVHVFGQRIPASDLVVMALTAAVGTALWWLLHRHRAGVQMRALVDDPSLLELNGVSPVRTARIAWGIGATSAVLAGALIAPLTALSAGGLALLIMNAFAAAAIGRLRSLGLTVVGAVVVGMTTAFAQGYIGSNRGMPAWQYLIGLVNVIPAVILFVVLPFLPTDRLRPSRNPAAREISLPPSWGGSIALATAAVLGTIAFIPLLGPGDLHTMTQVWGLALIALSLVPLLGWAGRLSVCPFAFAAVGAMAAAHLAPSGSPWGLAVAAACAAAVASLISLVAVRLSPLYLALATAAFAIMLDGWLLPLPAFDAVLRVPFTNVTIYRHRVDLFQGGSLNAVRPHLAGLDLTGDIAYFVFAAIIFALMVLALTALRRSTLGLRLVACRDSAIAYETVGLSRRGATVTAFAVSGAVAGIGGAVLAAAIQRPSPATFAFFSGLSVLVIVVIFGVASLGSAVAAGTFLAGPFVTNLFPSLSQFTPSLTAAAGIGLGDNPNGAITSTLRPGWKPLLKRPWLLGSGGLLVGIAYACAATGLISNWAFACVSIGFVIFWPLLGRNRTEQTTSSQIDGLSAPPEVLAAALPLSRDDVRRLDVLLGVGGAQ